jgi:hypothetical protein
MNKDIDIETMFRVAGINKIVLDYPDNIEPFYPEFTKEKQLEIIKILHKAEHSISYYYFENRYGFVIDDKQDECIEAKDYEVALALVVIQLWPELKIEEQNEIRKILREVKVTL